jgi:uroporphyrinogen decarboxylase
MRTLFMDYYLHPVEVHRLNEALCGLYLGYLRRAIRELRPDGYWTSDDLGHQKHLFMSLKMFRELLKPYYARLGTFLHENNLHWWLHSCGNNTIVLGDLAEAGVSVFHPVQKGTMDEASVAREFGNSLTFLAGVDVQHVLQEADPAGVRAEVRNLIDLFDHPEGGMCIAAGNGIVSGTPFENIEAFLDEAVRYGAKHRSKWA